MVENPLINHPQFQFQHSFENHLSSKCQSAKSLQLKKTEVVGEKLGKRKSGKQNAFCIVCVFFLL